MSGADYDTVSPRASIILLCYNHWDLTERCLDSIVDALGPKLGEELELVIVDNGSSDETPQRLEEWRGRATVVSLDPNRQFSGGCNAGAHAAAGEVLIFLNNDTLARPGVFEALVDEALDPTVGAVGLRLLYADMTIQHGGVAWYRDQRERMHSFHLFRFEAGDLPAASAPVDLDVVTGACLVMRRDLYFELGGFDEGYQSGFEDVDLCCKVRVAGYRVVYRGDLWMIHDEGLTRGRNNDEAHNAAYFHARWGRMLESDEATLAELYDARFNPAALLLHDPAATPWGSGVSVEGDVFGLAGEAAEARALIEGCERGGLAPAARAWQQAWLAPNLSEPELERLLTARTRPKRAGALVVHVPVGAWAAIPAGAVHVARIAALPARGLDTVAAVWAASAELADDAVADGVPAERVDVLPPLIPAVPLGHGGAGVLAILPAEDLAAAAALLDELAAVDAPVRLVPTVSAPVLRDLVGERLPHAQLLGPVSSELRLAALAGASDVVVCGSVADAFGRSALVAAAAGAAPVRLEAGVAGSVLGELLHASVADALASQASRAERAERVLARCGLDVLVPELLRLHEKACSLVAGRGEPVYAL